MNKLLFGEIERKVAVKKDASGNFGVNPEDRPVEQIINYGIINIDKPRGPTQQRGISHQVCDYVKRILGITKAGHSGTLE